MKIKEKVREMKIEKVFLDITNSCNANCLYCFTDSNSIKEKEMTDDEIIFLLNHLYRYGIKEISIGGGEPFLRNIIGIINKVEQNIRFSITTNGTILNKKIIDCLRDKKVKVTISLDTLNPEHLIKIRKGIDIDVVLNNIDKLVKFEEIRKNLSIRSTISVENIRDMRQLIDYCEEKGIHKLKVNSINAFGRGRECLELIPNFGDFLQVLKDIRDYSKNKMVKVELPIEKYLGDKSNICTLGRYSIYIDSLGNLYPCAFSEGNLRFGNVLKQQKNFIEEKLRLFDYENNICKNCMIHRYE